MWQEKGPRSTEERMMFETKVGRQSGVRSKKRVTRDAKTPGTCASRRRLAILRTQVLLGVSCQSFSISIPIYMYEYVIV